MRHWRPFAAYNHGRLRAGKCDSCGNVIGDCAIIAYFYAK